MGDIKRVGSGFSLSPSSPIFNNSLSLPKMNVGSISMPEVSHQQVFENIDAQQNAVAQAIGNSVRSVSQVFQSSSNFSLKAADGKSIPASRFLAPDELKQLARLPEHYQAQILNVGAVRGGSSTQIQAELVKNIKAVISDLTMGAEIKFSEKDGRQWSSRNLLDLANAVAQMPLTHRKQLDGVTFVRDDEPDYGYKGHSSDLLEKVANKMVAGHYDIQSRSVILYDRGLQDSFPILDGDIQQSIQSLAACSCSDCNGNSVGTEFQKSLNALQGKATPGDIASLQKMLNPYLLKLKQPQLAEDGKWSSQTETGIRSVQAHLLEKYLKDNVRLTPAQSKELQSLQQLASSPQFGMITRVVSMKDKMQNLHQIPDPHVQSLLRELAQSQFGETSAKFLLQDVSDASRSNRQVTRTEEVMIHEMGHHIQLGLSNENEYIAEFGKLSGWVKRDSGEVADGYINGSMTSEDMGDVYNQLASDAHIDEGNYALKLSAQERSKLFVTSYAATDPMEDFAESYKTYVLNPVELISSSPEKFFFINALPTIQSRKVGSGVRERSHYTEDQIRSFVSSSLSKQYQFTPSAGNVNDFIRQHFENMIGNNPASRALNLSSDTVLAIVDTHQSLLSSAKVPYIATQKASASQNPDYAVLNEIHAKTQALIKSKGNDSEARDFFYSFTNPNEIKTRFPKASKALQTNLKDPAFASMMLALGKIGGYASVINEAKNIDLKDQQSYKDAQSYFSTALKQPSALLSRQALTQSYNYLRGLGSNLINPEDSKIAPAMAFFKTLEADPAEAFPEGWYQFPDEFKEMLRNKRFVQAVSGDSGRYLPSAEVTRETLQKVMDLVEYQRGLDLLRGD
jgi:hypothetical protein